MSLLMIALVGLSACSGTPDTAVSSLPAPVLPAPEPASASAPVQTTPVESSQSQELLLGDVISVTIPAGYSLNPDPRMDEGRHIVWTGSWDGRPALDIWIDTYVGMRALGDDLLTDVGFDMLASMVSQPIFDGVACTPTQIDQTISGSERASTWSVDCVDKLDGGPGDKTVTLARGQGHLVYIVAFSGTGRNNTLEVPTEEVQSFYQSIPISFA